MVRPYCLIPTSLHDAYVQSDSADEKVDRCGIIIIKFVWIETHEDKPRKTPTIPVSNTHWHGEAVGIWVEVSPERHYDPLLYHAPHRRPGQSEYVGRGGEDYGYRPSPGHGSHTGITDFLQMGDGLCPEVSS